MTETLPPLLTERQACSYLGLHRNTLARARQQQSRGIAVDAPPFLKLGKCVRYDVRDLETWLESRKIGGAA